MKQPGIRIGKMSVRMSGVTARQAEQRAGSIAREIASSLAGDSQLAARGRIAIDSLQVRIPAGGGSGIAEQIRSQLERGRSRE